MPILHDAAWLSAGDKQAILQDNAAKMFKIHV
jgi:hypothetical protein